MTHIDEHTLELYVLGAPEVAHRRAEIEAHVLECSGCMRMMARMTAFYVEAEKEFPSSLRSVDNIEKALVKAQTNLQFVEEEASPALVYRPVTGIQRFQYFVRQHPVMTGGGTFALLAGLAMLVLNVQKTVVKIDPNPSYYRYLPEQGLIEVRNAKDDKVWDLPSKMVNQGAVVVEQNYKLFRTAVKDLDGDGLNELMTTMSIGAEHGDSRQLSILDINKNFITKQSFVEPFKYLDENYSPNITINFLVVDDLVEKGKQEIWLNGNSHGHSPNVTFRMDAKANIIGKYWHMGNLGGIYELDLDENGREEIVLCGLNQVADDKEFPCIIVLDPSKVVGDGKATCAPGFGFKPSAAELYYIALPRTDMQIATKTNTSAIMMSDVRDEGMQFYVAGGKLPGFDAPIAFWYFFNRDMSVREVRSNSATDAIHATLAEQGKVEGKRDDAYLGNLKNGVRYWDGKEWRKEVVKVNHGLVVNK